MYLKKTLETIGVSVLICFSFFLTEQTTLIMKDNDSIMESVKANMKDLERASLNAKINNDEIIPGISGKIVDIEKSYEVMKKVGNYSDSLIVYKSVTPSLSLKGNYDKYVVNGNLSKKQISLIFKIEDNEDVLSIINLLNKNKMKANFFITEKWASNNIDSIKNISDSGYVFGRLKYDEEKNDLLKSIIKVNTIQNKYYCYCEEKNKLLLDSCAKNKEYTILPSIIIKESFLSNIMKNIKSGSIISISINNNTLKELSSVLDYINSKGYEVVNLDYLLEE